MSLAPCITHAPGVQALMFEIQTVKRRNLGYATELNSDISTAVIFHYCHIASFETLTKED